MIKDMNVKQYRLFKELNIANLSQVNLIVGTNNCGKSSLLEAIHLLSDDNIRERLVYILNQRGEYAPRYPHAPTDTLKSIDVQTAYIFYGRSVKAGTHLEIGSTSADKKLTLTISEESMGGYVEPDGTDYQLALTCKLIIEGQDSEIKPIWLTNQGLLRYSLYANPVLNNGKTSKLVTTNYLDYSELATLWDDITLTPKEDQVIKALQILEPTVERLSFTSSQTSNSGILLRLANEAKPIPLGSMGDGMRRVLAIIASLVSVGSGNLLIDEIDTGLYYGVLTDMWRLVIHTAKQQNAQVFATTHSWDCVKAFQQALAMEEDDQIGRLIRLDRIDDQIKAVGYDADELEIAINQGIEVR